MKRTTDLIEKKQVELNTLREQSNRALDIVTSTIYQLENVNCQIDAKISEIEDMKSKLQTTEDEMNITRLHNTKIIDKFKTLIEV